MHLRLSSRHWLFVLLLFLWACRPVEPQKLPALELPAPSLATTPLPDDTLDLLFAGDIMGHSPQIKAAERKPDGQYDYQPCFEYIEPLIASADLAIGNLELTLPGEPPYQGFPYFRSPTALADALQGAGFDLLLCANNHANDAHRQGVARTIEALQERNLHHTGTFTDSTERALQYPLLIYRHGFKLAFLNYTYGIGRKSRHNPFLLNVIDTAQIRRDLFEARLMRPDLVVVCLHWGREYEETHNKKQQQLAVQFLRWGADLIVGAHPHVVQPIELYQMRKAEGAPKKAVVAYSLGNFISNQRKSLTDGGILLGVRLLRENGAVRLLDHRYHPIWRYIEKKPGQPTHFRVLPIEEAEKPDNPFELEKAALTRMKRYARYIRRHLGQ
ncbi:MAG: CapA family protein [Bacteroidota bacterium]